jgi:hypothetical protein
MRRRRESDIGARPTSAHDSDQAADRGATRGDEEGCPGREATRPRRLRSFADRARIEGNIRVGERRPQMTRKRPIKKVVFRNLSFGEENAVRRDALRAGRLHSICQPREGDAIVREKTDLARQV